MREQRLYLTSPSCLAVYHGITTGAAVINGSGRVQTTAPGWRHSGEGPGPQTATQARNRAKLRLLGPSSLSPARPRRPSRPRSPPEALPPPPVPPRGAGNSRSRPLRLLRHGPATSRRRRAVASPAEGVPARRRRGAGASRMGGVGGKGAEGTAGRGGGGHGGGGFAGVPPAPGRLVGCSWFPFHIRRRLWGG